jgi:hypothetical protein
MNKKTKIKSALTSLLLLSFLWILFFIVRFVYEESEKTNLNYVPKNAIIALKIDGKELIKSSFSSMLFESQDENTIRKIREFIQTQDFENNKYDGLNLLSDIVVFSAPLKNGNLLGFSLNLEDPEAFKSAIGESKNNNQIVEVIDNVGFILMPLNESSISKADLSTYFSKHIKNNSQKGTHFSKTNNSSIQVYTQGKILGESSCFNSSTINLQMLNSGFELDGDFTIAKSTTENIPSKILLKTSKNDFHFSSSIITSALQDSINVQLKKLNYNLPDFKAISFNYKGVSIVNDDSGMHPLPHIDLLLEFKKEFDIDAFLKEAEFVNQIDGTYFNYQLKIAGTTYYINQINKTTVSIGSTKNIETVENKTNQLFSVKGNLSSVLKIEGGGMIVSFLEVVPLFKSTKELFANVNDFDITVNKESIVKAKLNGKLVFKENVSSYNEITKFILGNQNLMEGKIIP